MDSSKLLFFAFLVAISQAGPACKLQASEEKNCALTCSDNNKFNYEPGIIYEFTYNAETITKMNGASEDSAFMVIDANFEIEPITKCDFVMRISDTTLRDSGDALQSQTFKEALMKKPLKFSFQDGRIDHICAMDGESTWALNIKRGILSAFQNSMDSFNRNQNLTETDVVGTCLSEYKITDKDPKTKFVEKTKNLLGCSDREGYRLAVQSIAYNVPSFVKSLPLMKSEYKCTQTLDLSFNILQSTTCKEEHVFRPFSYGKNGAMTISEQTLTFSTWRKTERTTDEHFSQRSTLLFRHQHDTPSKQEKEEKIEAKLQELCQKAAEDIRPEVPEMVNQLIEHMRQVDRDVLLRVYRKINQKDFCAHKTDRIKQYFHDAIPMLGTAASVGMIQDFISKKYITDSEAEIWLLSLSFVHHPSKEMVAAAMPLLDRRDHSGNTLLAVSSLASSYCNVRPDCGRDSEISALIRKLIDLTHDCNAQKADAWRIVYALRALGNIGHSHVAVSHLTRCFTRRDVPEEIRIAAMDAFRRVPCDAMRSDLMGVFRDESEDSELRLNAYIALMKCPSQNVLSEVHQVLEKEKSNQVGSFVWSHLTNLMETSDPHMQDIRHIVQDEELKKEFNLDHRKFSRNYEGSFFLNSINTGAKVDSNVIFSEKSFIPRSANLNLTIDLFGHAINFLEFGGRVQGLEKILENCFGSVGTNMKSGVRTNFKGMDAFRASAFLRVFGNELRYWDDKSLNELQSSLRKLMNMQALSFSKSMQLLDSRMIIPTCVGLPLSLTMSATGSISLDAKASFQQSKLEVNVDFRPSASVQVRGEMSVDAHVSRAGLKMVTVAHTSTGARLDIRNNKFDLQIPQKKMEIFNLKTDFYIVHRNAEKKQKMIVDNVKKHEVCTGNLMKQVTGLTFCQIIKFPNASRHNEAPLFPFTGPVVYNLYMMNEDAPNGYQIEVSTKQSPYSFYMDTPNSKVSRRITLDAVMKNKNEVQITFKAPWKSIKIEGRVVNHYEMKKLTGKLTLNEDTDYTLNAELGMKNTEGLLSFTPKLEITIPQKKMKFEGNIEVRQMETLMINMSAIGFTVSDINLKVSGEIVPKKIGLTAQLRIGKKEYYIASRLGKLTSKSGFEYTPSLKITIPNRDLVEFTSEILYETNKKMSFDFKLDNVFPKTVAMNAFVLLRTGETKTKHVIGVSFKSPRGNFRIIGDVDKKKAGITSRVIGSYNFGAKYSDRLTLSTKIRDLSVKKSVHYMGNIALESKKQEFLNFNLKGQLAKAINHLETKFDLHYGNPKIKTNNLKFVCVLNRALKPLSHTYDYTMTIQHPGQEIYYKLEANHVQSTKWPFKKFENTVMIQMAPGKVVQTKLSYNNAKVKGLPKYESEISLSYPGREMKITDQLMQVKKNTYENLFTVQWQKGREANMQSTYTKKGKYIHNIENMLRLPNKKEVKASAMLQANPGDYEAKMQFAADEGIISRQAINYKAEGGVTYTFNAKQMSTGVIGEVMWGPNQKVSANINFDYMKKGSVSGKLAFSTPFDAIKNFDSQAKFTWANSKYTSMMSVSWNNQNELKQDFSLVFPEFNLSYDASALLGGTKSEMDLAMKYSDVSLNGNIKIDHDEKKIIDVILKHNGQRTGSESEFGLDFNMFDSNGKIKINLECNKQKGEVMSTGEGKLNLPLQQLRQIGASYNLKHNNDLSSLDMSYSSSLENYRNGKMTIEMKRNLPKMLKATMDMTLNGKPMFNMNANYGKQKDNIDMKVDITEANGQKMTISANINLSGSRKTGNVEIKSRYINFSAEGALEYQGTRSAGGELKLTADGKSVMIRANYKKEGSTYKVTGTLGLPDGRSLKMEGSLDLQNIAASLKTMSPDFPELTEVDMAFFFNGDERMFSCAASLKVMPYFDTTQVEMKFTPKQFSIGMKTQFESMRQTKVTVTFDGDWFRSQKVKAVFLLNNEEMVDLDMNYNFNSINDFAMSMTILTSHRRYKEFQFDLKNKGPLSNMQSSLTVKLANVFMLDAMFQISKKASKALLEAKLLDSDKWKSTFELKGDLDSMTARMITSIAEKEVNRIDVTLKEYGRSINVKVNGPKAANFSFNMEVDTEAITFNMASIFTLNGREKYEISALYRHLSELQIRTSIPSYQDELLIKFSGNLRAFNMQTKFSHNNQIYDLMLSNKEYYRQLKGVLNTPYFKDTVSFKFNGEVNKMNIFAQIKHNNEKFELTFSNSGYYQHIEAKLDTPYFKPELNSSLIGSPEKFNFELMIQLDKQIYEMRASNKEYFRQINFMLDTPFLNCNFQFEGDLHKAKGSFTVSYGNTKHDVSFTHVSNLNDMQPTLLYKLDEKEHLNMKLLLKEYGTTITAMLKIQNILDFKYESEWDVGNISFNLRSSLKLQQEEMYNIVATYEHLTKLHISSSLLSYSGELMMTLDKNESANLKLKLTNVLTLDAMFQISKSVSKISVDAQLFNFDKWNSTFVLKGDLDSMTARMITSIAEKEVNRIDVTLKEYGRSINVKVNGPKAANFSFNMEVDTEAITFNMASIFTLNGREKYEISALYRHLSELQIRTSIPSYQDELLIKFSGNLRAFNMQTKFNHNNQIYDLMLSNKEYYRQLKGVLNTPYFKDTVSFKFDGEPNTMNILAQIMHNEDKFELTFSNSGYYELIEAELDTPYFQSTLGFSLTGNPKMFNCKLKIQFDKQIYEMKASNKEYFRQINFMLDTPFLNCNFQFEGDLDNAKGTFTVLYSNTKYEASVSHEDYFRRINFMLDTPFLNCNFQFEGDLHKAKGSFTVSYGNTKHDVSFTHVSNLNDMQATSLYKLDEKEHLNMKLLLKEYGTTITAMLKIQNILDFKYESEWDVGNISFNLRSSLKLQQEEMYNIVATYEHLTKLHISSSLLSYSGELMMTLDKNESANLKLKLTNVLTLDAMFQISKSVSKISVDAQLFNFDKWNSTFVLKGDLDSMTARMITSIAEKEVNRIDVTLKEYGRSINVKVNGPKAANFSFNMEVDTEAITFNMASIFTLNGREKYEISALYRHLSELQIRTSIPSYQDELLIKFSGNLRAFNMQTKFNHNNQIYDLMLSNKEYYRQLKGVLNTPYFKDTVSFKFDGEPNTMNILAQIMHNKDKFELTFSNSGYYELIEAELDTPYFQSTLGFSLIGNPKKFNFELKIQFDKQIYEMKASNEDYFRQINFMLDTPFLNCDFQFEGDLDNAKGTFTVLYDNTKYEVTVSHKNFFQECSLIVTIPKHVLRINSKMNIKKKVTKGILNIVYNKKKLSLSATYKDYVRNKILKGDLSTPYFKNSLTAVFNGEAKNFHIRIRVIHNGKTYELIVFNKNFYEMIDLNIHAPGMKAKLDFEGKLNKFKSFASVKIMNDMYRFGLSNDNYVRNIHMEVTTPQTGNITFSFDLQGELNNFNLTSQFSYRENTYKMNVLRDIKTGEHRLTIVSPQISINGNFNGDLKSFSFNANASVNKEKYELMVSTKKYFREISGKLTTPQFGEQSLTMKINGQLRDFSGFMLIKNNDEIYRSEFSFEGREFRLSLPKWVKKLQVKINGNWENFEFIVQLMNYNDEKIEISAINKNFKEMKARLAIPKLDDIDVSIKTSGNLRQGKATMKMSFGENVFENEVKLSFNGRQASFETELQYKILGRSGKAELHIDLMFEAQSYKYEFEADIEGTQIKSMASVKISPEISVLMTVSIPTLDASEMKLRIVSRGFQKTDMMLNLKSPWTGMAKIFYEHNGQMGKSFSTKGYIERDEIRLAGYSLDTDFSNDYSFDFRCDYDNSKNKIEAKGDLKFQGVKTVATLSINTPFRVFKEFFVAAQTKMLRDGPSVELNVKLPNQQYSLNIDLTNRNFNAILNLNMDKKNKDKQYQFQTSYKNTDQRTQVSHTFNFKMILPQRTVLLDSYFKITQHSIVMTGDLMWDKAMGQKVGFKLMVQKGEQREVKLRMITPRRTIELFGRLGVNGNQYSIIMHENNQAEKVDIKANMMIWRERADIDLTVKFPSQKKGMNLKTNVNLPKGDIIFSSTSEFSMDQDPQKTFKMSTKLMSETKGKRQMYTMQMDAGHAHSGFAIEVVGRINSTPEKYNADVEMRYLTLKRKQQKFALRGEMHRFNPEVNLKLEAPSKTIELNGSLCTGSRYIMSVLKKESGKENMEALFKLNPKSQRMNIIFNVDEANPNQLYRIDADIMKSKATFKAYRANKQRTKQSTDGRITVELRNNIFQSRIKWNPDLLKDLNVYGYQKLSMYGKELKSFGDSLSQVINEEVSMKFALAKRSFNEDIAPISDYFVTEYRSLSADFARAMHHMNQMFEKDSFYMKSAVEAISNVWDEMWFNYNEYLVKMKQEIEVFNRNMNHKMDEAKRQFDFYNGQYSMQLKRKVNELLTLCQDQYEMLYERAMGMIADIFSFIRNSSETIEELIARMYRNLSREKVINFLTEMYEAFNEKTVQAQKHIEDLTSAIYSAYATLIRHIASAKRHPVVDAIMGAVNKVYQQALWSYNYWNVKDNVLGLKSTLYKFGTKKIKEIKDIITDVGMNILIFDPKRGEIVVEIRFGAAKYFYNHFMSIAKDVEHTVRKLKNLMPSFNMNIWDIYYMIKPSSDLTDYIPVCKAQGTLFAGQYITTFDGRHFIYKATCSYLLARDTVHNDFYVMANFYRGLEGRKVQSITVKTALNENVEILPNNKVFFNGSPVKLPLQVTNATVTRQGNLIVLESKLGYKVMCDNDIQLYTVQISGFLFNKMSGLFGNFNNDPRDDMPVSDERDANDDTKYVWIENRPCKYEAHGKHDISRKVVPENSVCSQFFLQTDSIFRYCFRQVNPDQFYKICAMQLSSAKATLNDLCDVTSFYQKKCENKGVHLSTPVMCPKKV